MEKEMVFPGTVLGLEEEFVAGQHAYENDGRVLSDSVGEKTLDTAKYEAAVKKSTREVRILERGCSVLCVVSMVKAHAVLVEIREAEFNGERRTVHDRNGSINVRNIANSYVRACDDMYRIGDIVRARVLEVMPYGVELETRAPEYGVVKAFGVHSRKPLHLIEGKLRDPATGAEEARKIASGYLLG